MTIEEVTAGLKQGKVFVRMDDGVLEIVSPSSRSSYWFNHDLVGINWQSTVELHVSVLEYWNKNGWELM